MKPATLALLALGSATASAQLAMPRVDTRPAYQSTVEALYGSVSADSGKFSGYGAAARIYFSGPYFATVRRNDVTFAGSQLKADQFTYGLGMTEAWGQGTVSATYAHGKVRGDIATVTQDIFSVSYELSLARGLTGGLTLAHTTNSGPGGGLTAPVFSARYELVGGLSLTASYSASDTLLSLRGANHTWTVGARYAF